MPTDREARIRATVTKDGDVDAFREIADQIKQVAEAAGVSAPEVERLVDSLSSAQASQLAESVRDVKHALDDLDTSRSVENRQAAFESLEQALARIETTLPGVWEQGSASAEIYEAVLTQIRQRTLEVGDDLHAAFTRAGDGVASLEAATKSGTDDISQRFAKARSDVDRYREALDEAAAAGRDVAPAQEGLQALEQRLDSAETKLRETAAAAGEVDRELGKVEDRSRSTADAIGGVEKELGKVESRSRSTADAVGDVERELRKVEDGASGSERQLGKVEGRASSLFDRLIKLAGGVGLVTTALFTGWEIGRRVEERYDAIAKSLFGVEDAMGKTLNALLKFDRIAEKLTGRSDLGLVEERILDSQRKAFEQLGISLEHYSDDVQANQRIIAEAKRGNFEFAASVEAIANSFGLLTDNQLRQRAAALTEQIAKLVQGGLDRESVSEGTKAQVQAILEQVDRLPEGVRERIESTAAALGILPKRLEEITTEIAELTDEQLGERARNLTRYISDILKAGLGKEDTAAAVDEQVQAILAVLDRLPEGVRGNIKAVADYLGILPKTLQETRDQIRAILEGWGAEFAKGREELQQEASAIADAVARALDLGVLSGEVKENARAAVQDLVDTLRKADIPIPDGLVAAADAVGVFVAAMERAGGEITVLQGKSETLSNSTLTVSERLNDAGEKIKVVGQKTKEAAESVEAGSISIRRSGEAAAAAGASAEEGAVKAEQAGGKWRILQAASEGAGAAAQKAGESSRESGRAVEEGAAATKRAADATKEQADASSKASDQVRESAEAARDLAAAGEEARTGLAGAASAAVDLRSGVEGLPELLDQARESLQQISHLDLSPVRGEIQGLLGDLDLLIAKYADVARAGQEAFAVDGDVSDVGEAA